MPSRQRSNLGGKMSSGKCPRGEVQIAIKDVQWHQQVCEVFRSAGTDTGRMKGCNPINICKCSRLTYFSAYSGHETADKIDYLVLNCIHSAIKCQCNSYKAGIIGPYKPRTGNTVRTGHTPSEKEAVSVNVLTVHQLL